MLKPFLAAAVALSLILPAVAARAEKPLTFTVVRKGDDIGTHTLGFTHKGDTLTVDIHTRIAVKVLFATVYKFTCEGTETWKGGKLTALEAHSNDNGEKHDVTVAEKGGKLVLTADGKAQDISADTMPSTWWNKKFAGRGELLDYLTGKVQPVTVKKLGSETIKVGGADVTAEHYQVTGGLQRDLWFKGDTLVRQSLLKKGDLIEYVVK
jgi:hypothetical protein